MQSDLNKKIEDIYNDFKKKLKAAKDEKDIRVAQLIEKAEADYVKQIKNDIKL